MVASNKLTDKEKAAIPICKTHNRNEHTARMAIKTIIMDMMLSNDKMSSFMNRKPKPKPKPAPKVRRQYFLDS